MGGKTTKAEELLMDDPDGSLLIVPDNNTDMEIVYDAYIKNHTFTTIIIDEFIWMYNNSECPSWIMDCVLSCTDRLVLFSTPDRIYDPATDLLDMRNRFLTSDVARVMCTKFYDAIGLDVKMKLIRYLPNEVFESKVLGRYMHPALT